MSNFIKGSLGAIVFIAIISLMSGTAVWAAVDLLDIYTENQFTGRVKAFDIEYWNAVIGSGFIFLASYTIKVFASAVVRVIQGEVEEN